MSKHSYSLDCSHKRLFYISCLFCRCLVIRHISIFTAPMTCFLRRHLSITHIDLVSKDHKWEILRLFYVRIVEKFFLPHGKVLKALHVVNSICEQATVTASVERCAETFKSLLSRGIPYLQGVPVAINLHVFVEKLHPYCVEHRGVEFVADEPLNQRRLPHASVPEKNNLQKGWFRHGFAWYAAAEGGSDRKEEEKGGSLPIKLVPNAARKLRTCFKTKWIIETFALTGASPGLVVCKD